MLKFTYILAFALFAMSCSNRNSRDDESSVVRTADSLSFFKRGSDILPGLLNADSLQILFYDDPYGDSVRYSRYFTYISSADRKIITPILKNLDTSFQTKQEVTRCRSEGRIYLFIRQEPLKTIYFSSKPDSCTYLYFIKDGLFYEFELMENTETLLLEQRKTAVKPKPDVSKD